MVGVVLGAVNVDVHLVGTVEGKLTLAVGLAPGVAVEAFHYAALKHVGIVRDTDTHYLGLGGNLQKCLYAVVGSDVVTSGNHYAFGAYGEVVTLSLCRNFCFVGRYGFVAALADGDADAAAFGRLQAGAQQGYGE